jgi:hypothetical protein
MAPKSGRPDFDARLLRMRSSKKDKMVKSKKAGACPAFEVRV